MDNRADEPRLKPGNLEERSAVRFPLSLPVHLMTSGRLYEGTTENISANGVLMNALPATRSVGTCPQCGALLLAGSNYCGQCGAKT